MHAINSVPSRTQRSVSLPARSTARRGPHSALIRPQKSLSRENLPFPLYIPGRPEKYIPPQWGGASPMCPSRPGLGGPVAHIKQPRIGYPSMHNLAHQTHNQALASPVTPLSWHP